MLRSTNIFLADDDCDDVEFFTEAIDLISTNCTTTVFSDGSELIEGLKNCQQFPDIIFIDINMPIMNGFETLSSIKQIPPLATIPTVIYSTSSNHDHISKAYEIGASSYFKKPSDFNSLKAKLEELLLIDWQNFMPANKFGN